MNTLFKLLLAVSATSLLPVVYLIKSKTYLFQSEMYSVLSNECWREILIKISLLGYLVIPIILAGLIIFLVSYLGKDEIHSGEVTDVKDASGGFLPSYLGYFFVSLSIGDGEIFTLCFIFILVTAFLFLSQMNYYNPIFLFLGYKFYHIHTKNGLTLLLISKELFKKSSEIDVGKVYRVNDFTFIHKRVKI